MCDYFEQKDSVAQCIGTDVAPFRGEQRLDMRQHMRFVHQGLEFSGLIFNGIIG